MPAKSSPKPNRPRESDGSHANQGVEGRLEFFGGGEKMTPLRVFMDFREDMMRMKSELQHYTDEVQLLLHKRTDTLRALQIQVKQMDSAIQNMGADIVQLSIQVENMDNQLNPPTPRDAEPERYNDTTRQESPRYRRSERDEEQSYDPRYEEPRSRNRRYSGDVYDGYEPAY